MGVHRLVDLYWNDHPIKLHCFGPLFFGEDLKFTYKKVTDFGGMARMAPATAYESNECQTELISTIQNGLSYVPPLSRRYGTCVQILRRVCGTELVVGVRVVPRTITIVGVRVPGAATIVVPR